MNARIFAAVAVRITALVILAGARAGGPPAIFYASVRSPAIAATGQLATLIGLAVRLVLGVAMLVGADSIGGWMVPEPLAELPIGRARLTRLALSLVALVLLVDGIETGFYPLYFVALRRTADLLGWSEQTWQRQYDLLTQSLVMVAAGVAILALERLRAPRAALRLHD